MKSTTENPHNLLSPAIATPPNGSARTCPMCEQPLPSAATEVAEPYSGYRCQNCGTESFFPRSAAAPDFYESYSHPTERWEYRFARDVLQRENSERILEVGCGDGHFLSSLDRSLKIHGIDFNEESIKKCRAAGLDCSNESLSEISQKETFDAICMFHVLEHITDLESFFEEIKQALCPDGILLVSVPNEHRYNLKFARDIGDYPPHHIQRITKPGIRSLCARHSFDFEEDWVQPYRGISKKLVALQAGRWMRNFGLNPKFGARGFFDRLSKLPFYLASAFRIAANAVHRSEARQGDVALYLFRAKR